jgi:hypothetical protein
MIRATRNGLINYFETMIDGAIGSASTDFARSKATQLGFVIVTPPPKNA